MAEPNRPFRLRLGSAWTFLGALLGAASLASLIQRVGDVGLSPVAADVLDYYRWFMVDVVRTWCFDWWTVRWLDWTAPNWALDLIAIYVLQLGALFRSLLAEPSRGMIWVKRYPVSFVACLVPYIGFLPAIWSLLVENLSLRDLRILVAYVAPFVLTVLFFAWNAVLPTP